MFKSIKRKLLKNKKSIKHRRSCVDLDSVAASLEFQKDLGMVFDPMKKEDNSRLLNYFFIVGPVKKSNTSNENDSKSECKYEPSLLFAYPSHKFPFSQGDFKRVMQFCYPEGFEKLNSKIYKKKSSRSTKSSKKNRPKREKFVFGLNDKGTLYFCVVTRFYESLFDTLPTDKYPMCLVSVTSSTLLITHFTFHKFFHFIISNRHIADRWETYLRTNSITIRAKKSTTTEESQLTNTSDLDESSDSNPISPFINESKSETVYADENLTLDPNDDTIQLLDKRLLRQEFESDSDLSTKLNEFYQTNYNMHLLVSNPLFAIRENEHSEYKFEEKADKNFFRAIETLFRLQLLEERYQRISLHLDGENDDLTLNIEIPTLSDQLYEIGQFSFRPLFQCLSIKNVARYYRASLLEHQILLISDNISTLTRCALATLVMVAPMSPKCAILPVLPDDQNFLEYLGTPTPFVFGALDTGLLRDHVSKTQLPITVIDLTSDSVEYPDDVFHVPRIDVLKNKLKEAMRGCYRPVSSTYELFNGRPECAEQQQQPSQPPPLPKQASLANAESAQSEKVFVKKKLPLRLGSSLSESNDQVLTGSASSLKTESDPQSSSARYSSDLSCSNLSLASPESSKVLADMISPLFVLFNGYFVSQERLNGCRVRDTTDEDRPVIGFVKDAYMVNVADNEVDFYDALVETQTFQAYCEETYNAPA